MEHLIRVTYDRAIIRKALNRYFLERLGSVYVALFVAYGVFILFFKPWEPESPLGYLTVGVYVAFGALVAFSYLVRLRRSVTTLSRMNSREATFTFSDKGVVGHSELGSFEVPWSTCNEVLKYDDLWLIVYAKRAYLTLPTSDLNAEVMGLIERHCGKK